MPLEGTSLAEGSPPHARGRRRSGEKRWIAGRITPACAGKTLAASRLRRGRRDHPRMRGEDRGREWERWFDGGSPPHARGRQLRDRRQNRLRRITPACAGKTQAGRKSRSARRDHPRMRGEDYAQMKKGVESPGSPPHARGRRPRAQHRSYVLRITPACAGETRPLAERFSRNTDHPRMRGEDFNAFSLPTLAAGSPPHARGRRVRRR